MLQFLSVKVDILTSLNHLISHFTNVIMLLLFGYCSLVSLIIWKYFNVTDLSEIILRTHSNRSRFLLKTQVYIHSLKQWTFFETTLKRWTFFETSAQWCVFNNFSLDKHRHQIRVKFLFSFNSWNTTVVLNFCHKLPKKLIF